MTWLSPGDGLHHHAAISGLLGSEIGYSLSPALHEHEAKAQGWSLRYSLVDLGAFKPSPDISEIITAAKFLGFSGLNVTFPYKKAVLSTMTKLSPEAANIGAVNTIEFRGDGEIVGHNTDASGFSRGLRDGIPGAEMSRVLLIGAGGAGSAVSHALAESGVAHLSILDIVAHRADALAGRLARQYPGITFIPVTEEQAEHAQYAGIVNASPVGGTHKSGNPAPAQCLAHARWVADVVYSPLRTELLCAAESQGLRTVDGGRMLVYQAAASFEIFHKRAADGDRMRQDFLALLAKVL